MALLPEAPPLELLPDETIVFEWSASCEPHSPHTRGKLTVTSRRLVYRPTNLGGVLNTLAVVSGTCVPGGEDWAAWLSDITEVGEGELAKQLLEEGRMLTIRQRWGIRDATFFVLTSIDQAAPKIREAVAKADAALDAGQARWTLAANCVQQGTAVGGSLSLVGPSLVFLPSGIEQKIDGFVGSALQPFLSMIGREKPAEAREIPLDQIASIGKLESELSLSSALAGGLRDRLSIEKTNGEKEIFVVSDLDAVIERLQRCVASRGPAARA